jgi:uncharacterized membrane protein YidH (DUF202 family)
MSKNERTPLIPPSNAPGDQPTVYFLERRDSKLSASVNISADTAQADAEEIETLPEGSTASNFEPRPVTAAGVARANSVRAASAANGSSNGNGGWFNLFGGKKGVATGDNTEIGSMVINRKVPVKVDPKVFFANERTFLAWLHVSTILAGASVAIVAFSGNHGVGPDMLYGVIMLPVAISFIVYAIAQCEYIFLFLILIRLALKLVLEVLFTNDIFISMTFHRCTKGKHDTPQGSRAVW